ncbi:MAG: molybdopterin-guanine dinucleotide biosynthesis protein B [Thermodesulfobacteriota bacterium]
MVPTMSIVGFSGSGKTTLIVKVVEELTARGYRVGTIKHDAHKFEIDREGKDSWRHKKAGAKSVLITSAEKLAFIKSTAEEMPLSKAIPLFMSDLDVVITEGYKTGALPKIEVYRSSVAEHPACLSDPLLLALVSDGPLETKKPLLDINDFMGVADIIENKIIKAAKADTVCDLELTLNGQRVSLQKEAALRLKKAAEEALEESRLSAEGLIELRLNR